MKLSVSLILYVAIVAAAIHCCHSLAEFVVVGFGPVLALDRYFFRWLPWSTSVSLTRDLCLHLTVFAVGTAGFFLIRLGSVPLTEAVTLGGMATLVLFLLESCAGAAGRIGTRFLSATRGAPLERMGKLGARVSLFVVLAFAVPLEAVHPLHTVPHRTPAAQGLEFEDVRISTSDGLQLAGWLLLDREARGNVIFCHGHGRNRGHASWLFPTLHDLHLNVLAFDFRGHGDSAGHTSTFGHEEVRDLVAAVEYLGQRCPGQPLFIIGVSLGAAVTLQALPELPNVRGVWSEGCFSRLSTAMDHYFDLVPSEVREPLLAAYNYAAWLDCGFWPPDISPLEDIARTRVPIYFCHGCKDELVPLAQAEELYEAYAGPKWHFWVAEGNHYNLRQVAREEYLHRLRHFIEDRLVDERSADRGPKHQTSAR